MIINDANGHALIVDADGHAHIFGTVLGPLEEQAAEAGTAAFFNSTFTTDSTNQEVLSIKNDDDLPLHITRIIFNTDSATVFTFSHVTAGTGAGTVVTYLNPKLGDTVTKSVTAKGDAEVTGITGLTTITKHRMLAGTGLQIFLEASVVLQTGKEVCISVSTTTTIADVTIIGFWKALEG